MRLRRSPVALRFYKGNRDKSAARHFRREFILYYPWGLPGQPNFATMSDTEIENHFSNEDLEHIAEVKGLIMPHLEDVEKQKRIGHGVGKSGGGGEHRQHRDHQLPC